MAKWLKHLTTCGSKVEGSIIPEFEPSLVNSQVKCFFSYPSSPSGETSLWLKGPGGKLTPLPVYDSMDSIVHRAMYCAIYE